ncbi:fluoride efflux transporter CrcB [Hyphomicrobium sp.]|uniref:fluoride efflux transporter CrcB n=1 Tax=Hyphomicrobium sp. TaxID=82 RepID=UPI002E372F5D|nr:fluoride efflux transporter CrcB [Hyphomicrobium sp.]HEX2841457.1 fluoride efflux transporter CrcB [Hyphomicrobium sp.]
MQASIAIFFGAGLGGLLRHAFNTWITALIGSGYPYGILAINVIGSTVMGIVAGWFAFKGEAPQELKLFLTTGILGGFTTFSAFSLDTALLIERGESWLAATYVIASVVLSIFGLFAGLWAMRALL